MFSKSVLSKMFLLVQFDVVEIDIVQDVYTCPALCCRNQSSKMFLLVQLTVVKINMSKMFVFVQVDVVKINIVQDVCTCLAYLSKTNYKIMIRRWWEFSCLLCSSALEVRVCIFFTYLPTFVDTDNANLLIQYVFHMCGLNFDHQLHVLNIVCTSAG